MRSSLTVALVMPVLVGSVLLSCTGNIILGGGDVRDEIDGQKGPLLDVPPVTPLRRLTRDEFANTVKDLLGAVNAAEGFPEDAVGGSGFYSPGSVSTLEAQYLLQAAEKVGAKLTAAQLATVLRCSPATDEEAACAADFITRFGKKAYRRPLNESETVGLLALFNQARTTLKYTFDESARFLLQAILQSPGFLYHNEAVTTLPDAEGLVRLDAYALASRLSYFLWNTMPDDALFAAAAEGRLETSDDIAREARRMIGDEKFRNALKSFHWQWLGIKNLEGESKDETLFPQFTPELVAAMQRETLEFVSHVVLNDGRLKTMLTAPYSFINADLAKLYGLAGVTVPAGSFSRVELNPDQRAGVLTQASFLAWGATSTQPLPPRRGLRILEQFLCQSTPPPPNEVPSPPEPKPNVTNRERFEEHNQNGCATACHQMIDPLGFAFENYDAVGAFRFLDSGKTVDASGAVPLAPDAQPTSFKNAVELTSSMANSKEVSSCVATHWFRYALGRADQKGDEASLDSALQRFLSADTDLRELMVAIAQSRSFRYRTPSQGEVAR